MHSVLNDLTHDSVCFSYFEQGLAYVGSDFLSHALWDKYLNFEASEGHVLGQAQLYSRILGCPIKELNRYYQR